MATSRLAKFMKNFERRAEWLFHPDSPGMRVLVVRGFWGRLFKPCDFATLGETIDESLRITARQEFRNQLCTQETDSQP